MRSAAAALLCLAKEQPLRALAEVHSPAAVAAAIARDPQRGAELLFLGDASAEGRIELLAALPGPPDARSSLVQEILLQFAAHAPLDVLPFFVAQPGLLGHMQSLLAVSITDRARANSLSALAGEQLGVALLSEVLLPALAAPGDAWSAEGSLPLILGMLQQTTIGLDVADFVAILETAPTLALQRLLALVDSGEPLPLAKEILLGARLARHSDPLIRA